MRSFSIILATALMAMSAEACKCLGPGNEYGATLSACDLAGGTFTGDGVGDVFDCSADSMSDNLSVFQTGCVQFSMNSDCGCPNGC